MQFKVTQNLKDLIEIEIEVVLLCMFNNRKLKTHNTSEDIESIFIEINMIKAESLFCNCYHSPSQTGQCFFENIGKTLDKY